MAKDYKAPSFNEKVKKDDKQRKTTSMYCAKNLVLIKRKTFITAILILLAVIGNAQELISDMQNILIRNVTVIDQTGKTEDVIVSILIKQKKLELVTQDKIDLTKADIAFDANGGFILGRLELGNLAGFIILDQDPRINVDVMLDTRTYSVFAVSKGEVLLNKLVRIDVDSIEQVRGWQSYAPPAVALPLSYQNKRKWNVFRTKPITGVFGGAIILDNTRWFSQDSNNEDQVGDLDEFNGGSVRGFRAGLGGTFNFKKPWTYLFSFGTKAFERGFGQEDNVDEFILYDYRVSIPIGKATLSLGKTKETISISRLSAMIYEPGQQERASVADGLLPARNIGVVVNNTIARERMTWSAGVFNNWIEEGRSISDNPTIFTGRITGLPFISEDESNLLHVGISGRYSNAAGGIRYQTKTEIFNGPVSVDTEQIDAESSFHYGLEMAWRKGPFILTGEYIQSNVNSATFNDPSFKGYYVVVSYVLTGEMRGYNKRSATFDRVGVAKGVNSGGWGELDVYSRWSSIDLTDNGIDGGEMNTFSVGLNWSPISAIQVNINYRYSTLDRIEQQGFNHGLVTRLVFILE